MRKGMQREIFESPLSSEEDLTRSTGLRASISTILSFKKWPVDSCEWESYFDDSGQLLKSRDYISAQIMERGLDPSAKLEAWKFLTGYYSWRSTYDERLVVNSRRRKNYESLCNMCEKIQPLLESALQDFLEVQNSIKSDVQRLYLKDAQGNTLVDKNQLEKILLLNYMCNVEVGMEYQQGFHEMLLLFRLLVEKEHEIYWLFQFFLQKTENSCIMNLGVEKNLIMLRYLIAFMDPVLAKHLDKKGQVVKSLCPWFCLCFQRVLKSFDDVWRLWEVFLTRLPCRNFQVMVAYTLLQLVRDQVLREDMSEEDILMLCNNIADLDADELITKASSIYELLLKYKDKLDAQLVVSVGARLLKIKISKHEREKIANEVERGCPPNCDMLKVTLTRVGRTLI
ncbi:TBC1 domain family member 21 [Elgaria multicarinata webbii]|uniref:TBC1 domain family member 21 n=1 Tax=Elgaria multicarinata webbii TaxID=159646 RepID=UPI002FCD4803